MSPKAKWMWANLLLSISVMSMFRHRRLGFQASKDATRAKDGGGEVLLVMFMPQLEIHPFFPGCDVPGAPVSAGASTQKSSVVPQWPQILQQTLSGQGFKSLSAVPPAGGCVPETWGPHRAPGTAAGIGGLPVERQICWPGWMALQPTQPHVFLLTS